MLPPVRPAVLLVDDDPILLSVLSRRVSRAGYDVRTASSGADALKQLEGLWPALLVVDLMMPGMDGFELCRRVKRIADLGMQPSNLNAFTLFSCGDTYHPTWIEHDGLVRQRRIDHTIACIELAAEVGIATVSLQPGGPLIGTGMTRECSLWWWTRSGGSARDENDARVGDAKL